MPPTFMPRRMRSHLRNKETARPARPLHERELLRICGLAAVQALFHCDPGRVERLFFEPALKSELDAACRGLARVHKPYREADGAELIRIAGTVLHGGVVAIARPRPLADVGSAMARAWAQDGKPLLILDGIGNPHNLGAIARSAAFFGLTRLLLADRPDQALPSDAAYRVAEGGLEYLALYRATLPAALHHLRHAYRVIGTSLAGGSAELDPARDRPVALIFGNENAGLDAAMLALCDEVIRIPGSGLVQSLNVASAAAILIYLLTRSPSGSRDGRASAIKRSRAPSSRASTSGPPSTYFSSSATASSVDNASRRGSRRIRP
jgi:RNA methyltransferase, TrmH family